MDTIAIPPVLCLSFKEVYGNKNVMDGMIELSSFLFKKDSHNYTSRSKKMNLDLNFTLYTKTYSKWTVNLNVKHKIVKLLGKKKWEKIFGT